MFDVFPLNALVEDQNKIKAFSGESNQILKERGNQFFW